MSAREPVDSLLLCYCTNLTVGELRRACLAGAWPPADKERTGKLCTGCVGDLLYCLRHFGAAAPSRLTLDEAPLDEPPPGRPRPSPRPSTGP
jgi:hypothetical protein